MTLSSVRTAARGGEPGRNKVFRFLNHVVSPAASRQRIIIMSTAASDRVDATFRRLQDAKAVAILRAKNYEVALQRGVELVELGCKAIEVTCDSVNFEQLLVGLVQRVGDRCCVGVGTVLYPEQLDVAARSGAVFALSPVHPTWDYVRSCHRRGVLAVPAASSPQEIYQAYEAGARIIKVFPAQLWTPSLLSQVKAVGLFGQANLLPSGGITPAAAPEWLKAGAIMVGMGSRLVGKDVRVVPTDVEALKAARQEWIDEGRSRAAAIFKELNTGAARL